VELAGLETRPSLPHHKEMMEAMETEHIQPHGGGGGGGATDAGANGSGTTAGNGGNGTAHAISGVSLRLPMLAVAAGEQLRVEQQVQEGLVVAVRVRLDCPQERLEPQTQVVVEAGVADKPLRMQVAAAQAALAL
jgi:hypothetical protein